jgi:hypothetical protein
MSKAKPIKRNPKGQFTPGTAGGPGRRQAPKKLTTNELLSIISDGSMLAVDALLAAEEPPIPTGLPPHVEEIVQMKRRMADAAQRVLLKRLAAELGE